MDRGGGGYPSAGASNGYGVRSQSETSRSDAPGPSAAMSKAEKFDDEKKRLMSSCFVKRDETGKLVQSYITHVRVEEDGAYQSTPAPPNANPQHKKPRVIILAVKASGRVAMHKARENDDGTFQIGKSWGLDELQSIQTFSNFRPDPLSSPQQRDWASWAGDTGFIITMSKPYYWKANSPKEKEFFIGSLVKIYNKFTNGRVPALIGFDQHERDAIIASTKPPGTQAQPVPQERRPSLQPSLPASLQSRGDPRQPTGPPSLFAPAPSDRPFLGSEHRPGSTSSGQTSMLSADPRISSPAARPRNGSMNGPRQYQTTRAGQTPSISSAYQSPTSTRNITPQLTSRPSYDANLAQAVPAPLQPSGSSASFQANTFSRPPPHTLESSVSEASFSSTTPSNAARVHPQSSERSLNNRYEAQQMPSTLAPVSLKPSTSDRWRPPVNEDRSTPESWRTAPESAAYASARSRSDAAEASSQGIPERRRPPLENGVYGDSTQSTRSIASSGTSNTPVGARLKGPFVEDETLTSSVATGDSPVLKRIEPVRDLAGVNLPPAATSRQPLESGSVAEQPAEKQEEPNAGKEPQFRPGLGPMMSKKAELASKIRKAAVAHKAFVPRAGGAGDRLLGKANKSNEPDGVTGVVLPVRAPPPAVGPEDQSPQPDDPGQIPVEGELSSAQQKMMSPPPLSVPQANIPEATQQPVNEKVPPHSEPSTRDMDLSTESIPRPLVVQRSARSPERQQPKKKVNPFARCFELLGVEPTLGLDKRAVDFSDHLNELGWERSFLQKKQFDALQAKMIREVGSIEAGSWLGHTEDGDDRIEQFEKSIDRAISAVDEVDGLLTLYSVELSTLVDDVAYIETQSQGLQVQTANQKLLHAELEDLLDTVSLDTNQLSPLRVASLGDVSGIEAIERSLALLYKALEKIDPLCINRTHGLKALEDTSAHGMRALQDRKHLYLNETGAFLQRLLEFSAQAFGSAFSRMKTSSSRSSVASASDPYGHGHDTVRAELWKYSPLMLFAKELGQRQWDDLCKVYVTKASEVYRGEVDESIGRWKAKASKPSSEEEDALFTTPEKETETFSSAARKMTVKRSATLAKSFRSTPHRGDRSLAMSQSHGDIPPHEAFLRVLETVLPMIAAEQNFITDFFHITVLDSGDFLDTVGHERPNERRGTDVYSRRPPEPAGNRDMALKMKGNTKIVFSHWFFQSGELVKWASSQSDFQLIGVLGVLERARLDLEDTNQEFLLENLKGMFDNAKMEFDPFVDKQIKAIDNVKVKTNKRRGLMSFTRRLPNFATSVENTLPNVESGTPRNTYHARNSDIGSGQQNYYPETRALVEKAYERIITTIFKNLETIAKGTSSSYAAVGLTGSAESEDKEKLNHEILLIENMHHIATNLDPGNSPTLQLYRDKATTTMAVHRDRYVEAIVRRPLGRLVDFLELVGDAPRRNQVSQGRSAFKKALGGYDAKSCRRDVDALRKRVEKHFSPQEGQVSADAVVSAGHNQLIVEVLDACSRRFEDIVARFERLAGEYDPPVEVELSRADVVAAFGGRR